MPTSGKNSPMHGTIMSVNSVTGELLPSQQIEIPNVDVNPINIGSQALDLSITENHIVGILEGIREKDPILLNGIESIQFSVPYVIVNGTPVVTKITLKNK